MTPRTSTNTNSTLCSMNRFAFVVVAALGLTVLDGQVAFGQCQTQEGTCFQGIGDLPGGNVFSAANGVARAADGRVVVVGRSSSTASTAGGLIGFEEVTFSAGSLNRILTPTIGCFGCVANDVTIVGSATITVGQTSGGAFRVVQDRLDIPVARTILPDGPGSIPFDVAYGISDDGSVVVGNSDALRWTSAGGTTVIPLLENAGFKPTNSAFGVSPHGTFTVGTSSSVLFTNGEAFIVPPPGIVFRTDPVGLGFLDGGELFSVANAISN
ncbi:MAG: hypothetical protein GXP29_00685, partial [Planctomycetes bacterium]|nr:hypothetical protein [Planctomycetota bacterium]